MSMRLFQENKEASERKTTDSKIGYKKQYGRECKGEKSCFFLTKLELRIPTKH